MAYSAHATNPIFSQQLTYDADKDFTPIVFVGYIPLILVTNPASGFDSVQKVIEIARAKPGTVAYASGGAGAGAHLSGELLKYTAKIDLTHVPYKGNAPALNDMLGNQVPIMFDTITTALPHVKAGKLRALAVTSPKRSPLAPDVPTMIEAGLKDFEISAWYMVLAPRGTPPAVVQQAERRDQQGDAGSRSARAARQPGRRFRRRHAGRSTEVHALGDRTLGARGQDHRNERQLKLSASVRPALALGHANAATCCRRRRTWRNSNARGDRRRRTTPRSRWRNTFAATTSARSWISVSPRT